MKETIIQAVYCQATGGLRVMANTYADALENLGYISKVCNIGQMEHPNSLHIKATGHYDAIAKLRAYKLLKKETPLAVFCHCSRSIAVFHQTCKILNVHCISVSHSFKLRRMAKPRIRIAISDQIYATLNRDYPSGDTHYIPNCAKPLIPKATNHPRGKIIGYLGRVTDAKGIFEFLRVFRNLHQIDPDYKAVIAGKGDQLEEAKKFTLRNQLSEFITFLGWIDNPQVLFDQIDALLFLSHSEVMPLSVLEAFSARVPVVINCFSNLPINFRHNENIVVTRSNDIEETSQHVSRLLSDDLYCSKITESAHISYQRYFSCPAFEDKLAKLIESLGSENE